MKKIKLLVTIAAVLVAVNLPKVAKAWGVLGHRIVGQIAEYHLTAKSKKAVAEILGTESMAMAANWADFIKSDTSYNYVSNWHYVNLPEKLSKSDLSTFLDKYPSANIYAKTNDMIAILKDKKSTSEQKKFALRILIHLLGDMHQPMHTARKDDLGGNRIFVTWFGEKSNLHRVWDENLIDFQQLSYTEYANALNNGTAAQIAELNKASIKDVIFESYEICNKIYASGIKADDKLTYRYNFDWIETVNSQLFKGGIRLAKILNEIYK